MQRFTHPFFCCFIFIIFSVGCISINANAKQKNKLNKQSFRKSTNYSAKKKTKQGAKKQKLQNYPLVQIISDTSLARGVRLTNFMFGRHKHNVFKLEIALDSPNVEFEVVKSLNAVDGLERLIDMTHRLDSCCSRTAIAAVNANFWRAYRNLPIGPLIINGEVVQMLPYKQWSSAFFDVNGRMTIDRFTMSGLLKSKMSNTLPIVAVNYRRDSLGICLYNQFAGEEIPIVTQKNIEQAFEELRLNALMLGDDSTEKTIDAEQVKNDIARAKAEADAEFNTIKAQAKYIGRPLVNKELRCLIDTVAAGRLTIPRNGCIMSFGLDVASSNIPRRGDTVLLNFTTEPNASQPYLWAVSGTPRLVRNGIAKQEASAEGVTSSRFISKNLARTAIGTDKDRTKNIIVVVEANNEKGKGATLAQTAAIMKQAGAWNAINLDGGGSTRMIVGGRNVFTGDTASSGRRVAAALAIFQKNKNNIQSKSN